MSVFVFFLFFLFFFLIDCRDPLDNPNFLILFVDDLGYGDLVHTGHPTTRTPNIDQLASEGMILTTWYSGYPVCSASRTALMTSRYVGRTGVPGVIGNQAKSGLPLNETVIAEYLKKKDYATGIIGKWHLGQREMYLPANRSFDHYLGIPYSVDMGTMARETPCNGGKSNIIEIDRANTIASYDNPDAYTLADGVPLPLVLQTKTNTTILEQPLDLTTLNPKYAKFATDFIEQYKNDPFLLYVPFSHVHTAHDGIKPDEQYASCNFINSTTRGRFGDGLAEVDWMIGQIMDKLRSSGIEENTFVIFTSDNGPWLEKDLGSGSTGIFTGRASGYWNTGKGSTWEGGIREPAFAYWKGQIEPRTVSSEIISSMDVGPTILKLAGIPLPTDRIIDGKDFFPILKGGKSAWRDNHLYHYWGHDVHAVRYNQYKAHFITAPGLGGCNLPNCKTITHDPPLLFDVEADPSEAFPLDTSKSPYKELAQELTEAKNDWVSKFVFGSWDGATGSQYEVCCDRTKDCVCTP